MMAKIGISRVSSLQRKSEQVDCEVKMCALQEKFRSATVEVLADMLTVVMLAKRSLDLNLPVMKREQALVVEGKLQITCSAAMWAQHSALAKAEEACKCQKEL